MKHQSNKVGATFPSYLLSYTPAACACACDCGVAVSDVPDVAELFPVVAAALALALALAPAAPALPALPALAALAVLAALAALAAAAAAAAAAGLRYFDSSVLTWQEGVPSGLSCAEKPLLHVEKC